MKVRITKAGKDKYWYSSHIGECFEVGEYNSFDYETLEGGSFIAKVDCEVIPYEPVLIAEQPNDKLFQAAVAAMQGMLLQNFQGSNEDMSTIAWDIAEALINEGKKRGHL